MLTGNLRSRNLNLILIVLSVLLTGTVLAADNNGTSSGQNGQWVSFLPAGKELRVLTDVLWSTVASEIPTQLVQHRWIQFPAPIVVSAIRIEPVLTRDTGELREYDVGNRPRHVLVQTSSDGGVSFETIADIDLSTWTDNNAAVRQFKKTKVDNVRIVISKSDKMAFPTYPNANKIEFLVEDPEAIKISQKVKETPAIPTKFKPSGMGNLIVPSDRVNVGQTADAVTFRSSCLRMEFSKTSPRMTFLGWDIFNNTNFEDRNLLCTYGPTGAMPCVSVDNAGEGTRATSLFMGDYNKENPLASDGSLAAGQGGTMEVQNRRVTYRNVKVSDNITCDLIYDIYDANSYSVGFDLTVDWNCRKATVVPQTAALRIPFDLQTAVTSVLAMPDTTGPIGLVRFPMVINAPDFGQLRVMATEGKNLYGAVHSHRNRSELWLDFIVGARPLPSGVFELLPGKHHAKFEFRLTAIYPYCTTLYGDFRFKPVMSLAEQDPFRSGVVRSWLNGLAFRPDIGVFANNSVSDAARVCQAQRLEHAMFTPSLAEGLDISDLMRFTLEQMLYGASFWGMDPNIKPANVASVLDSVWCYLARTNDWDWARKHYAPIEQWTQLMLKKHSQPDGLLHELKSGNCIGNLEAGVSWWDAISSGGVEAYNNALAYRALLRAAQIMGRLGKQEPAVKLRDCAARLKAHYKEVLYNPQTGWIAGWRGKNGILRDFGNIASTGAAITCGVIEPNEGRPMLQKILAKLDEIGFTRYDFGLPQHMLPVPRDCTSFGAPLDPDGNDFRQIYMNGSATTGQAYWFIQALYICGMRNQANKILSQMCEGFYAAKACGPLNSGVDWKKWDGRPSGYEGLLTDMFRPLQAVLTGYIGLEYTLDGLQITPPGSAAQWLIDHRKSKPDFGRMAPETIVKN